MKLSSLCVAVAGPTNFAPIINQIARWVVKIQFTRVQSVFEWINDLCQLKFDPIFTTFFLTVRAFVFGYV